MTHPYRVPHSSLRLSQTILARSLQNEMHQIPPSSCLQHNCPLFLKTAATPDAHSAILLTHGRNNYDHISYSDKKNDRRSASQQPSYAYLHTFLRSYI